jgi:hypothetical protein
MVFAVVHRRQQGARNWEQKARSKHLLYWERLNKMKMKCPASCREWNAALARQHAENPMPAG